jgi:hypothetical protein
MKLDGEFTFQGTRQEVWDAILDPKVLAVAVPGTQKMEKISDNEYASEIQIKVGPVSGNFAGKVTLQDMVAPQSYTMLIEGKGGPGFAKGTCKVEFISQDKATLMKYSAELQIGGKIASVGQRLLDTVGKSMAKQSLESIQQALQVRLAVETSPIPYTAPSQSKFAFAIAKDLIFSKGFLFFILALLFLIAILFFALK